MRVVALLVTVAVLGAGWYWLAPEQLGGKTSYAVTFGISMEPHFHHGDLVVLRKQSSYHVGEVVAYHSHDLKKNVLHRIIAIHGDRFTFKGDNNSFVDPEHPTAADLVGAEWLHVPTAGNWLASLHSPRNAAIAAFLIVLLLVLTGGGTVRHRHRRRNLPEPITPRRRDTTGGNNPAPSIGFVVAGVGAGALVAAAALGALAFTRPLERSHVWADLYVQHGTFSYAARVPRGATYQSAVVRSGEPVYLQLVHRLPVAFSYRLQAAQATGIRGTERLDALLHDDAGWEHTLVLAPSRPFEGSTATVDGVLDLRQIQRVIATFERETGVHNTLYHVTLAAHVAVQGTVAARPLVAALAPSTTLNMDAYELAPAQPATLSKSVAGAGTRMETASLHALGRSFTVAGARRLAKVLGLAGLVLAALGGALVLSGRREQEVATIRRKYEDWIVDVMPDPQRAAGERRVPSMEALARLAERYERLILHERRDGSDAFLVEDDGVVYAYTVVTP